MKKKRIPYAWTRSPHDIQRGRQEDLRELPKDPPLFEGLTEDIKNPQEPENIRSESDFQLTPLEPSREVRRK